MIKKCLWCQNFFQGNSKKQYCSPRCKKNFENEKSRNSKNQICPSPNFVIPSIQICKPQWLNGVGAAYWDLVAPTVIARGHLNVLSEAAFAELCDLYARLVDINDMIEARRVSGKSDCGDKNTNSLLEKGGSKIDNLKESVLSDLKRKYSTLYLNYCKQFYLTPITNRGKFGLNEIKPQSLEKEDPLFL
jgi:hypothetical protein